MKLTFTLSLADFKAAFRLHRRQTLLRRLSIFIWPILTIVCFVIALASNVQSELFSLSFAVGVAALWLSIVLPIVRMISVRRSYKRIFPSNQTDRECFAEVGNERVVTGVTDSIELRYAWDAITGFSQDGNTTLFYTSKCSFLFFPTNAMLPEQREELKTIVARNMVRKQK